MSVSPIPEGYHTITPYLVTNNAAAVLDFVVAAFGAEVTERLTDDDGGVMHAQARIGDSHVMIGQSQSEDGVMPAMLYLYVDDADAWYAKALEAGGVSVQEPRDEFYGDRNCGVRDSSGNVWFLATRVEDVPSEEIERRLKEVRGTS